MALTLVQSKVGMANKMDQVVIDIFRRESRLLDMLIFDNAVSPGTGGSTLTYGYQQVKTPSTAAFRSINAEYTSGEAVREAKSVDLKIFGGKFGVDRVIANTSGAVDELAFQMAQKIKGAVNLFNYTLINGKSSVSGQFDGLDAMLKGTETEYIPAAAIDLSTTQAMDTNAQLFADTLDEWLGGFAEKPDFLLVNNKMATKIKSIARRLGYYSRTEDAFGRGIDNYDGIAILKLEQYFDGSASKEIIGIDTTSKETSIYAIKIALDGLHGVSAVGDKVIQTYQKAKTDTGVILDGEVEAVMGIALKNSRKAGVLRKIKVMP
ncbi:MAG: major capsid protein [Clostridium sp.]|uniref:major capsid protein n=1 Tax=Clostridium sp. TaxID=1506 RepID=UPI003EE4B4E5